MAVQKKIGRQVAVVSYEKFAGSSEVKQLIEKYHAGKVKKLSELHDKAQEAMGGKFGRSRFFRFWKQWRLDRDAERRAKLKEEREMEAAKQKKLSKTLQQKKPKKRSADEEVKKEGDVADNCYDEEMGPNLTIDTDDMDS